ncbi:glutathione S-transferase family protein [Pseudorhodoferax sp. Leaf267]|uniref:glutathione S-transferase family protein n=1 Tax=Pseudorhodoferax sp. Leaf267 TaxID=1736316 RepID=UPI0006F46C85|nr:glutathione S-transferase family protein [Pseudorhodoferax sp. Leaf267]KQP12806.1 glutathione S-transferase [Pseudorhodoferax sp. Leaf267]
MLQLYYHPTDASMAPHMLLEELGVPFELKLVDRANQQHKSEAYLRLNPNGLIPVLVDGELVLYETAAILLHLADTHPQAGLAPTLATAERAHFYKWLMWLSNTLHATLNLYFYPERWASPDHVHGATTVKARAEARVGQLLQLLDQEFERHGQPWLLGERYTALDPYLLMLGRWTRNFGHPARDHAYLGRYLQRVLARPAVQRAYATEQIGDVLV